MLWPPAPWADEKTQARKWLAESPMALGMTAESPENPAIWNAVPMGGRQVKNVSSDTKTLCPDVKHIQIFGASRERDALLLFLNLSVFFIYIVFSLLLGYKLFVFSRRLAACQWGSATGSLKTVAGVVGTLVPSTLGPASQDARHWAATALCELSQVAHRLKCFKTSLHPNHKRTPHSGVWPQALDSCTESGRHGGHKTSGGMLQTKSSSRVDWVLLPCLQGIIRLGA